MIRNTIISLLLSASMSVQLSAEPDHVIFTYMGDPSTTLTANWQNFGVDIDIGDGAAYVYYDTVSRKGDIDAYEFSQEGHNFQIVGLNDRSISRVQLEGLKPSTVYYLTLGHPQKGFSEEYAVKTIPADDRTLRFVTGGDMGPNEDTRILLQNAATHDPDFAVVGGDIAYANGRLGSVDKWDTWLGFYTDEMLTSDGRSIPLVLAVGNHEVNGGFNKSNSDAPFFFNFFGQDTEKSYFSRQFGSNFVLLALDSGHLNTHESQVGWITETLAAHQSTKYTAAVYHVPLYPSHRDFMGYFSDQGREHWAPVFDRHELTVAFENHDHSYKRSHLLRNSEPTNDNSGTLYLGDGCWGVKPRPVDHEQRPYLKHSGGIQHFWLVEVDPSEITYRAINLENNVFDVYPENHEEHAAAAEVFASLPQTYKMPAGVVQVLDIPVFEEPWQKGSSEIKLENTFTKPMFVSFEVRQSKDVNILGLPSEVIEVKPGAKHLVPIKVLATKESGIALKEFKVVLATNVALKKPGGEITARFSERLPLNLRAKE